jgi:hypothetical protein
MDRALVLDQPDDGQSGQLGVPLYLEILNRRELAQPVSNGIHDPFRHDFRVKEARFMAGNS